jgi:hypothetical protein
MVLGIYEIIAAFAGSLAASWWLLFMKYGKLLEAKEEEADLINEIDEGKRTPEQISKLLRWTKRQKFLQKFKYRLFAGMGGGLMTSILYLGAFMKDANSDTSIIAALMTGMISGLAGTAVTSEVRATGTN